MRKSIGLVGLVGVLVVGCSGGEEPAEVNDGASAETALASADAHETKCPRTTGGTYSRGSALVTRQMRRSVGPVVFLGNPVPPQRLRAAEGKPWVKKAPIAVRVGTEPVDVALMDSDGAKVAISYDDSNSWRSIDAGYRRVRFVPCEGDPSKPTWYSWPGGISSDRENVCLKFAIREGSGEISVQQHSFGSACPEGSD